MVWTTLYYLSIAGLQDRSFPSSLVPLFQSESKCKTILMKMTDFHEKETACRTHFHMKGFALRLVLKQRHKRTRKWPIYSFAFSSPVSTLYACDAWDYDPQLRRQTACIVTQALAAVFLRVLMFAKIRLFDSFDLGMPNHCSFFRAPPQISP